MRYDEKLIEIGLNIAYHRKLRGLKQHELADQVFISREQLSRIESAGNTSSTTIPTLIAIADVLDIDVRRLFEFRGGK